MLDRLEMRLVICALIVFPLSGMVPGRLLLADNRVLVIGIDGAGGSFLNAANAPAIDALIAGGGVRYDFLNEGALVPSPPSGYGASGVNWSTPGTVDLDAVALHDRARDCFVSKKA